MAGALSRTLVASVVCLAALCAPAQTLYRWMDAQGRIHYSDTPPKNPVGPVTRIEPDEKPDTTWKPPAPKAPAAAVDAETAQPPDRATQRRATRNQLEARVQAAREKLANAKAALEAGQDPQDDEHQVIQQRMDKNNPTAGPGSASTGGMNGMGGMLGGAPRSNCKSAKDATGNVVTMCPTAVPTEAYYERIQKLEDDVKAAEEELAAAEQAYRRGVD
ncbi:MAG TPA: DUF4124 domain-containing protein [Usitatibacter sp.]|nr:DUF4124 domain-containing protein [Usitatibacter sp.]